MLKKAQIQDCIHGIGGKELNIEMEKEMEIKLDIYFQIDLVHRKGGKELNIFIKSNEAVLTLHTIHVAWKQI